MAAYHDESRRDIAVDSVIFHVVPRLTVVSGHRIQNIDFFIDGQQPHRPVARTRTAADIQRHCRDWCRFALPRRQTARSSKKIQQITANNANPQKTFSVLSPRNQIFFLHTPLSLSSSRSLSLAVFRRPSHVCCSLSARSCLPARRRAPVICPSPIDRRYSACGRAIHTCRCRRLQICSPCLTNCPSTIRATIVALRPHQQIVLISSILSAYISI